MKSCPAKKDTHYITSRTNPFSKFSNAHGATESFKGRSSPRDVSFRTNSGSCAEKLHLLRAPRSIPKTSVYSRCPQDHLMHLQPLISKYVFLMFLKNLLSFAFIDCKRVVLDTYAGGCFKIIHMNIKTNVALKIYEPPLLQICLA